MDDVELQPLALTGEEQEEQDEQETDAGEIFQKGNKGTGTDTWEKDGASEEENARLAKSAMRKVSWRVLPLLGLAVSIAQVEKVNIALASEGIMRDLGLSTAQFGLATSLYFIPYAVFQVPVVIFMKRFGIRRGLSYITFAV